MQEMFTQSFPAGLYRPDRLTAYAPGNMAELARPYMDVRVVVAAAAADSE